MRDCIISLKANEGFPGLQGLTWRDMIFHIMKTEAEL